MYNNKKNGVENDYDKQNNIENNYKRKLETITRPSSTTDALVASLLTVPNQIKSNQINVALIWVVKPQPCIKLNSLIRFKKDILDGQIQRYTI